MATIPDISALGARPAGVSRRPIQTPPTAGVERAANIFSRAAAQAGQGTAALGQAAFNIAEAGQKIQLRRESVERIRLGRELGEFARETFTDFSSSRDFSKKEDLDEFNNLIQNKTSELLGATTFSPNGKLRALERAESVAAPWRDKAAVAGVKAQDALVIAEQEGIQNGLAARVRQGEDPDLLIAEGMRELELEADSYKPGQEIAFEQALKARIWGAKANDFMSRGSFDDAEDLMERPDVRAAIGEKAQTAFFNRIEKARREGKARILTEAETAARGFPPGVIVQKKSNGDFNILMKPEKDTTLRSKKIKDMEAQFLANDMDPEEALNKAINITDGNIRIEIVENLGVARLINELDGTVEEVSLGIAGGDIPVAQEPREPTVLDLAMTGNIAGAVPAAQEFLGETLGQFPGVPVATQVIQNRQTVRAERQTFIKALALSRLFPVKEQERLAEDIKLVPKVFDSQRAFVSRIFGVVATLRPKLRFAQKVANNPNMPDDARADAKVSVSAIENFLERLGVPDDVTDVDEWMKNNLPPKGIPDYSTRVGTTEGGLDVWQDPKGTHWIDEG